MTDREDLFIRTIDDLRQRLQSRDPYEVLGISSLLRKLLLDHDPLVNQVNRTHRLKLTFAIGDPDTPMRQQLLQMGGTFWTHQDSLDPETCLKGFTRTCKVTRDQLLATEVFLSGGRMHTIKDVILFAANIMGGVHAGMPKSDQERALQVASGFILGGNTAASLRQLLAIARVVERGLRSLYNTVKSSAKMWTLRSRNE